MNLWLLTSEFPPSYGGGIGTYALHTARMFTRAGHNITVITGDETIASPVETITEGRLRIIRFQPGVREESACLGKKARLSHDIAEVAARLIAREGPPDLIESQEYLGLAYFLLQRRWCLDPAFQDIPVILTLHTPQFICDRYNQDGEYTLPFYWLGEMERFTMQAADALVSPSRFLLDELSQDINFSPVGCSVIPNPFEPSIHSPWQDDKTADPTLPSLVNLGRLERRKGILKLLEHFSELWQAGFSQPLSLVGGDFYSYLHGTWMSEVIRKKYQPWIESGLLHFERPLPQDRLFARLQQASLVIIPSLFENFPYAVLETMALGVPVLASTSGGQAEIIQDGISGFTFSHVESGGFHTKLMQALELDPPTRQKITEAARARVAELCAFDTVYAQKMEAYERALTRKRDRRLFPFLRGPQKIWEDAKGTEGEKGLLSVVIPYYNAGKYLGDALESLDRSSYTNNEIVVVDDGSHDPTSLDALNTLSKRYTFQIVRKKNGGLASARNAGAQAAHGEFLAFLDADDTVEPEYFTRAIDLLHRHSNVSFVGCWARYWGESTGYWPAWNPEPPYLLTHNMVVGGSLVYRKAAFLQYGLNDPAVEYGMEDYESTVRMVMNGCRGVAIPEPYFNYRIHADSMFRDCTLNQKVFLYNLIATKHSESYQAYGADVANILNSNGPGFLYENPTHDKSIIGGLLSGQAVQSSSQGAAEATMPPASPGTYLYFAMRSILLPIYKRIGGDNSRLIKGVKMLIKPRLVK